jgi:adhesin transport system membrane fusion protein
MLDKETLFARSTPLNPGRAGRMLWLLVILIFSFCAWASWAKLDEQVRARGEVVVTSRSQVIQVVDGGVLDKLHVRQGDRVKSGELLAELRRDRFQARLAEAKAKTLNLRANIDRLTAELMDEPLEFHESVAGMPNLVRTQTALHETRLHQQREERESLQTILALAREELAAMEKLAATGDAAQAELLRSKRQVSELEAELSNKRNQWRREAREELTDSQAQLDEALQVLRQRQEEFDATYLMAPMSGTIKNIEVTTIGAVLKSGEKLMEIVPSDEPLLIEAKVGPRDVAFIRPGLEANVKLDAYDFTIYGALEGEVTYISPDTIDEDL